LTLSASRDRRRNKPHKPDIQALTTFTKELIRACEKKDVNTAYAVLEKVRVVAAIGNQCRTMKLMTSLS